MGNQNQSILGMVGTRGPWGGFRARPATPVEATAKRLEATAKRSEATAKRLEATAAPNRSRRPPASTAMRALGRTDLGRRFVKTIPPSCSKRYNQLFGLGSFCRFDLRGFFTVRYPIAPRQVPDGPGLMNPGPNNGLPAPADPSPAQSVTYACFVSIFT